MDIQTQSIEKFNNFRVSLEGKAAARDAAKQKFFNQLKALANEIQTANALDDSDREQLARNRQSEIHARLTALDEEETNLRQLANDAILEQNQNIADLRTAFENAIETAHKKAGEYLESVRGVNRVRQAAESCAASTIPCHEALGVPQEKVLNLVRIRGFNAKTQNFTINEAEIHEALTGRLG